MVEKQEVRLPGMRGQAPIPRELKFGNVICVTISYGSKIVELTFLY
jgi:hypothetical protein